MIGAVILPDEVRQSLLGRYARLRVLAVYRDSGNGRIDAAAVDSVDAQVAKRFAFHPSALARVLSAPLPKLLSALEKRS